MPLSIFTLCSCCVSLSWIMYTFTSSLNAALLFKLSMFSFNYLMSCPSLALYLYIHVHFSDKHFNQFRELDMYQYMMIYSVQIQKDNAQIFVLRYTGFILKYMQLCQSVLNFISVRYICDFFQKIFHFLNYMNYNTLEFKEILIINIYSFSFSHKC